MAIIVGAFYVLVSIIFTIEFNYLIISSIFWAIIKFFTTIYITNMLFWRIILFSLYCYRSKLLLSNQNNLLYEMKRRAMPLNSSSILTQMKSLNEIYCRINDWNKIWSKYIAINLILFSILFGLLSLQLYFGNFNIIFRIFMFMAIIIVLSFSIPIFLMSSIVNTESKKTFILLSNIFLIYMKRKSKNIYSLRIKFKVILINLFIHI